uniref:24-hydroxycholesterol 7-alpha-hydroxylase n=1 Tax=Ornithorhynchus anatinus TaxID=9258 RepID=A0A6I8NPC6_ORNAN
MEAIFPSAAIALGLVLLLILHLRSPRGPPCIGSWIPWFGAAYEFGKAPLDFIERARGKYGPIFTVFALGNRMTFVTEEEGINTFFKSKEVSFELAVQNPVYHTASISKEIFFLNHDKLYGLMKGKMSTSNMHHFFGKLVEELHEHLEYLGTEGTQDLCNLVRNVLFPSSVNILFGKGLFPTSQRKIKEFEEQFRIYDEGFEFGSQMPECLLRNWSKSKQWFLRLFEKAISDLETSKTSGDESKTLMQNMLDILKQEIKNEHTGPSYAVLLLWASQSNAVPIAFWTLAFLLSHPSIYKNIMEDLTSVFGKAGKRKIQVSEDDLKKLPLIKWCVLEAIRLRAPGVITRKVVKPVKILNYTVPSGDILMLSPFWLHRNPKYFPEPEVFKPERWKKANLEKNAFLDCFVAFGGGKCQCPGRWFALMEIQIFVILILYKYDFTLLDPVPKQSRKAKYFI